jgi:CheY-like chemotaxis protein
MNDQGLRSSPTVLVVDDEELMREVVAIMIEENGGTVIEAMNGLDAVEKFKDQANSVDCVFMDFSMPEMNGYEAYCEIRKVSGSVPFVMVSGLQVTPEIGKLKEQNEVAFLSKPFHEEELLAVLNERLSQQGE